MRRLFAVVVVAGLLLPFAARAQFLEGVEYQRVANPQPAETGAKIEVRELFWYGCPHCYALEPLLEKWEKTMPRNAQLVRTPAVFNERWAVHARAYYAFEALGLTARLHRALFDVIHAEHRQLFDPDSIAAFVAAHGGDRTAFLNAYNSFGVAASVNKAALLGQAYGIDGVPTIIVDGKYLTSGTLAGDHERMLKVVDFLIAKAAAERRKAH